MPTLDAVIIGAGHNGMVCATYLAKAGLKVTALERRSVVGGPVVTEEVWPGYRISVAAFWMSLLQPKIMMDLDLGKHGIEVLETPPGFQPFADGSSIVFWPDTQRMVDEIRTFSAADAEAYPRFIAHMERLMPYLRRLLFEVPVDPTTGRLRDVGRALSLAWRFRDIGARFYDIWDLLTLSAYDFLRRWFESEKMLTALGSYASGSGGNISPKTPGSAYVLARPMLRDPNTPAGPGGLVKGGMGSVTQAIRRAAEAAGVVIRTNAEVARVIVENGAARGVELMTGERIEAKAVIANANAQTTFLRLVHKAHLPAAFVAAVKRIRTDSSCFKINLATDQLPRWSAYDTRGLDASNPGFITIAESLEELEEAFEAARHGRMAPQPYLWILTPSAFDSTVAPSGKHVVSVFGGHVPYRLRDRDWDDTARDELYEIVMRQITRYAPGFGNSVIYKQILVPRDLERIFDLPGGHVHHGELSLDQIFLRRPVARYADYRSPILSLYQCGASTHPGGGVTGVPGHNAARVVLDDLNSGPRPAIFGWRV
ncbi:MAG TPA: NAD(P)/FAD-dependent oxidoreductase [Dongiaceae bacterium]|jgi:phytoene dehydrogenase-like protein|nr:NAD(P)/FAD-dependent oxidoreductase [Dongiaceae bacterium]